MSNTLQMWLVCLLALFSSSPSRGSSVVQLTSENFDSTMAQHKLVFVNFYADWCRFSQMLTPIFEQTSDITKEEFPSDVALGRIDCEDQQELSQKYHVSKYPTMKLFRKGQVAKREYRGQRSVDAFSKYLREQMKNQIHEFHSVNDVDVDSNKRSVIAYLENRDGDSHKTYERVAEDLRDDCQFHVGFGDASVKERQTGENIVFRGEQKSKDQELVYMGDLTNFDLVKAWVSDKCVPLVREITFENAEELTEEGIPFLLLFHHPDDTASPELYKHEVATQLAQEKGSINFLVADGMKFAHPLHHLGKSQKDLPIVAIDSFRHMYLLPKFDDIRVPGRLAKFVSDLHSGKLHREFHHGPETLTEAATGTDGDAQGSEPGSEQTATGGDSKTQSGSGSDKRTTPPETVFKKLSPSYNRYTLLKDEL